MNKQHGEVWKLRVRVSVMGLSVMGLSLQGGQSAAQSYGSAWRLRPTLEISETYTDNVELAPTNERSDLITTITPGLNLSRIGARLNLILNYSYGQYLSTTDKKFNEGRHNLNSRLDWSATDWLAVDAGASIAQDFLDRRQQRSINDANFTQNRQPVYTFFAGPRVNTRLGELADLSASYNLSFLHSERGNRSIATTPLLDDTTTHDGSISLDSGRRFSRLRWTLSGTVSKEVRKNSLDNRLSKEGNLNLEYALNRHITAVARGGYEDFTDTTLNSQPGGFYWDGGVRLTGPRSRLEGRIGRRYGGTTYFLDGNYTIDARTSLSVNYHEDITSAAAERLQALTSSRIDPTSVEIIPGFLYATPIFLDNTYRSKIAQATLSGQRGRNSFGLSAGWQRRRTDNVLNNAQNQKGYTFGGNISHQLSPRASATLSLEYDPTKYEDGRSDKDLLGSLSFSYSLADNLNGNLRYSYTDRASSFGLESYKENAVAASLSYSF